VASNPAGGGLDGRSLKVVYNNVVGVIWGLKNREA
jgi:hypothetical protein